MIGMSTASALLREDLRAFGGYSSARSSVVHGDVWLNANESPSASPTDAEGALRRYPDPQPQALRDALASLYGVVPAQVLATRGSDDSRRTDYFSGCYCFSYDRRTHRTR